MTKVPKSYTRQTLRSSKSGSGGKLPSGPTAGIVYTGERYKNFVKMTFAKGAALKEISTDVGANPKRPSDPEPDGNCY
jgi:hypothetical protein